MRKKRYVVTSKPVRVEIDLTDFRNDLISEIGQMLTDFMKLIDERFDRLERRMASIETKNDNYIKSLKTHDVHLDNHELRINKLEN